MNLPRSSGSTSAASAPHDGVTDAPDPHGLYATPIRLHPQVERLVGANEAPMLHDRRTGRYIRVTPLGARVLDGLDQLDDTPTGQALIHHFAGTDETRLRRAHATLLPFLTDLYDKGVLDGAPLPQQRQGGPSFVLRLPLSHNPARFLGPVARVCGVVPGRLGAVCAGILTLVALVAVAVSLPGAVAGFEPLRVSPLVLLCLPGAILVHESAHAVLLLRYGAPPRSAGLGLLFYVLPIFYVDRTDAYKIRNRSPRVAISLAGPWCDLMFGAGAAVVAATVDDPDVRASATAFALFQTFAMLYNLNPVLHSDGYHAIEAATGETNARSRAFRWFHLMLRRAPVPAELADVRGVRRACYALLVVTTCLYVPLVLTVAALAGAGALGVLR